MEIEQAFGVVIRNNRNQKLLSQEELADLCGLDRTFISLLERGKRNPTLNTIFALASGLDIAPNSLILDVENLMNE